MTQPTLFGQLNKLPTYLHMSDIQGLSQLATQGVLGVTGLVYGGIKGITRLAGGTVNAALTKAAPLITRPAVRRVACATSQRLASAG